jgi:Domain of unknown function (DUF4864)
MVIRNRDMRTSYLVLVIFLGLLSPARSGDELDAAKALIRSQVDAIGRDDSAAAYAFASPGIQKIFPGSDAFLKMVKDRYPPIYRHKLFSFGDSHEEGGQIAQEVLIIDADGTTWKGLYTVEHENGDGSLKVSGCVLVQAPGQPV